MAVYIDKMRVTTGLEHYRLIGYLTALTLHGVNGLAMLLALQGDILKDPQIKTFHSLQWVYITIWNMILQLIYAGFGILCDLPTLLEIKEHTLIKYLKSYREVVFTGLILPTCLVIFFLFWPIYIYDRELVFPEFIDKALSQWSNHIMHTAILPIVLWEFVFLPKTEPKSKRWNFAHTYGCYICYLFVLFGTYAHRGIWPYPILAQTFGTLAFPGIFAAITVALYLVQCGLWPVNALLWRTHTISNVKIK